MMAAGLPDSPWANRLMRWIWPMSLTNDKMGLLRVASRRTVQNGILNMREHFIGQVPFLE